MSRRGSSKLAALFVCIGACTDQSDDVASGIGRSDAGTAAPGPTTAAPVNPGDGGGTVAPTDGGSSGDASACASNPLHTGLVAQQTGISVDSFDCEVIGTTAKYSEPDAMIFKAMIYVESRFDRNATACPNLPCGTPAGWTDAQSRCYGLLQVVPACNGSPKSELLPNGHPNLTTDATSSDYSGSVFNPSLNIDVGISGVSQNRAQVTQQFPGCTVDQYTMMAIGNFNSYGSTKSCTVYNTDYTTGVVAAYRQYAQAAGYAAHSY